MKMYETFGNVHDLSASIPLLSRQKLLALDSRTQDWWNAQFSRRWDVRAVTAQCRCGTYRASSDQRTPVDRLSLQYATASL